MYLVFDKNRRSQLSGYKETADFDNFSGKNSHQKHLKLIISDETDCHQHNKAAKLPRKSCRVRQLLIVSLFRKVSVEKALFKSFSKELFLNDLGVGCLVYVSK